MEYYITQPADYWIAPNAVAIVLNALGDKNRIHGSVASGAVVMCFVESIKPASEGGDPENGDGLYYGVNHEPKRWPLTLSPTFFNDNTHKYVYVAIPRSASVGTQAVVVFPSELLDIYGRAERVTTVEGETVTTYEQIGSTDYFYVFLQGIISAPAGSPEQRAWEDPITDRDWGILETAQGRDERQSSSAWYSYSEQSQLVTFLKEIVMSAASSFRNLFLNHKNLKDVATSAATTPIVVDADQMVATPGYVGRNYLSKTIADTAAEKITFSKGITANGSSNLNNISVSGTAAFEQIQSDGTIHADGDISSDSDIDAAGSVTGNFVGGNTVNALQEMTFGNQTNWKIDGSGNAWLNMLTLAGLLTGKNAVLENLTVTNSAHFFELVIDELRSQQGAVIITSANCKADIVETVSGGYKVLWRAMDSDGHGVRNSFRQGDQAICQTFDATEGVSFNVSTKYYWRLVNGVGTETRDNIAYHYIILSNSTREFDGTDAPAAGDNIVQLGYRPGADTDPLTGDDLISRQSALILSAYGTKDTTLKPSSLAQYQGINTFALNALNRRTYFDAKSARFVGDFAVVSGGTTTPIGDYVNALAGNVASDATTRLKLLDVGCSLIKALPTTISPAGPTVYNLLLYVIYEKNGNGDIIPLGQLDDKGIEAYLRYRIIYTDGAGAWNNVYLNDYEGQGQGWDGKIIAISASLNNTGPGEINYYTHLRGMEVLLTEDDSSVMYDSLFIPFAAEAGASFIINQELGLIQSTVASQAGDISQISQTADNINLSVRGNGRAGTNLLLKPELSQANVTGTGTPWLTSTDTSATAAFLTQMGEDGGDEYIMQVDLTSITPTSGKKFDLRQSIKGVVEPLQTYVASIYVRNIGYESSGRTNFFGVMMEWSPSYMPVPDPTGKNPATEGWYELVDGSYVLTADTQVVSGKTYYIKAAVEFISAGFTGGNIEPKDTTTDGLSYTRRLFEIKDTAWHRVWVVFRMPSIIPTTLVLAFRDHISGNKSGSKWQIELPKLEEGAVPTAWSATSDALKRAGIDITRGKIRLDADTVEVARDLTIGGNSRIGGFVFNLQNVDPPYENSAFNPFNVLSLYMEDWIQQRYSTHSKSDGNGRVMQFPECGASIRITAAYTSGVMLVLPFRSNILSYGANNNPYTGTTELASEYEYLNTLLASPFDTALQYVGSVVTMMLDGGYVNEVTVVGVRGFGQVSIPQSSGNDYYVTVREYEPWGYYSIFWTVKWAISADIQLPNETVRMAIQSAKAYLCDAYGKLIRAGASCSINITQTQSVTVSATSSASTSDCQMKLVAGSYARFKCLSRDGNVYWEIEDINGNYIWT